MNFRTILTILALLLAGSVNMIAQEESDPFPDVSGWNQNMPVTCQVLLNGVQLTEDVIVAAYSRGEIRGKSSIDEKDKLVYLSVGDNSNSHAPLYFRVYTGGRIIEVDQGMTYIWNGKYGSYADPYIINLTVVNTNTSAEGWATTCLPYNAAVPEGVTVYAGTRIEDGVLKIEPVECNILPANTPVLLKTEGQKSYEWLSRVADGDAEIETNLFKGTTETLAVASNSVLTLGHASDGNHAIGFWKFTGTEIPANRAYLEMPAGNVRGFTLSWSDEAAALAPTLFSEEGSGAAYDLQGRKVRRVASKRGSLMIVNGKKLIVK